jgi:hypothetical protein
MLPGRVTFRHRSRYSPYQEKTFARWYAKGFDFVSLNKAAIAEVIPPTHEQALVMDASFVSKSGQHTYGLDRFWNGSHSRTEKGLEISALAWLDVTGNCAYCLSVEQTPSTGEATGPETTRIDVSLDQLTRVVSAQCLRGCLKSSGRCEPTQHQARHGEVNHCLTALGQPFIVLAQAARLVEPRQCPCNNPPPRQQDKACGPFRT